MVLRRKRKKVDRDFSPGLYWTPPIQSTREAGGKSVSKKASRKMILNRMNQVGEAAALVGRRREVVRQVEETRRRVREAQHLARVWAGPLIKRGHFCRE